MQYPTFPRNPETTLKIKELENLCPYVIKKQYKITRG